MRSSRPSLPWLSGPLGRNEYRTKIAFGPKGTIVMPLSETGVNLWDVSRGVRLGHAVRGDGNNLLALASDPGAGVVASAGYDEVIDVWRVTGEGGGRRLERDGETLEGHSGAVTALAFSPGGERLASGGSDGTVRLWSLADRSQIGEDLAAGGPVAGVAIDPAGETVAAVGEGNGEIRLWDVDTRKDLGEPLPAHAGGGTDVAFSGDGRSLLTAGLFPRTRQGTSPGEPGAILPSLAGAGWIVAEWDALLWSGDRDAVTKRLCAIASRNLIESEWEQFLPDEEIRETCEQWPAGR